MIWKLLQRLFSRDSRAVDRRVRRFEQRLDDLARQGRTYLSAEELEAERQAMVEKHDHEDSAGNLRRPTR